MEFAFRLPDVGEGVHEAEILRWLVSVGDEVKADQPLVEVQTDKVAVELPSPVAGVITARNGQEGEVIGVGSVLVTIVTAAQAAGIAAGATGQRLVAAAPTTRRLARELGVDLARIAGTGPAGRITDDDVRRAAGANAASGMAAAVAAPAVGAAMANPASVPTSAPDPPGPNASGPRREDQRIPLRGVRRAIAAHMVRAKATIPHAAVVEEADMGVLQALRGELAAGGEPHITYLPFIVKAVARALTRFPQLNARLDEERGEIVVCGTVHMGIAVATDDGLKVPVIRDAAGQSLRTIAAELADLAGRTRAGQVRPEELSGSTFTISNIGAMGGLLSLPIINHPEAAILGMHRVQDRPVVRDGQVVVRPMAYLSLCFDHRIIDGDVAARFITAVVRYVEKPTQLFMEMA